MTPRRLTSRRPAMESADTPAPAILKESPGAPSTQPKHKKSRRRRRRKAARIANQNAASRQADPMTPDERCNENSASRSTTRPSSAANDLPEMMSTPVYQHPSFHSSRVSQLPIPATNENAGSSFRLDHPEFSGLYKPAQTDPSHRHRHRLYTGTIPKHSTYEQWGTHTHKRRKTRSDFCLNFFKTQLLLENSPNTHE